jgi:hypothetical protein
MSGKVNPISVSHQPRFLKLFFPEAMHAPDNARQTMATPKISEYHIHHSFVVWC